MINVPEVTDFVRDIVRQELPNARVSGVGDPPSRTAKIRVEDGYGVEPQVVTIIHVGEHDCHEGPERIMTIVRDSMDERRQFKKSLVTA